MKTNNNAEYTRRYVQGVADGDAFSRSKRSLAKAWNIYAICWAYQNKLL